MLKYVLTNFNFLDYDENLREPRNTVQKFTYDKRLQPIEHLDELIGK